MQQRYTIICFSLFRWDAQVSSTAKELAKEWSKQHRVFYIENPPTWKDVILERNSPVVTRSLKKTAGENFFTNKLSDNLYIITPPPLLPVNFLPQGAVYNFFRKKNEAILNKLLQKLIKKYAIDNYIFINFYNPVYFQQQPIGTSSFITAYYCLDEIAEVAYTARHGIRAEKKQVQQADYIFCSSKALFQKYETTRDTVFYIPNGANTALFQTALQDNHPLPEELKNIDKKIIGYTGSIDYRMNFELVNYLASHNPGLCFCFTGPASDARFTKLLQQHTNILHIPSQPIELLPAFINRFQVLIIPFKKNKLTAGIYPLKLNEYLATGKPVVSTRFSEDLNEFENLVYLAENAATFNHYLQQSFNEDGSKNQLRISTAKENSWENRANEILNIIKAGKTRLNKLV